MAHGLTEAERAALPAAVPIGRFGAFERALASSRSEFVADPADERVPDELVTSFGIGSFVIVPLLSDGRCLGFMSCDERGEAFALEPAEAELLTTFGSLIATFLEKAIEHGELRRLNEMKSQFAALASHELRTPVTAIYGAIRTLEERAGRLTVEQQAELRALLRQQSQRLFELVENLLDLSRLEADSIRITPTPLLIRARLRELVSSIDTRGRITLEATEDLAATVDAQAFDRIVSNLLTNALRHGAPPIRVSAERTGHELSVTVEDRGPGVPPEFVPSLFERFTRASSSAGEGAGLGLSIAQSYARAHGGALRYQPARPHGSRFRLALPTADAAGARSRPAPA